MLIWAHSHVILNSITSVLHRRSSIEYIDGRRVVISEAKSTSAGVEVCYWSYATSWSAHVRAACHYERSHPVQLKAAAIAFQKSSMCDDLCVVQSRNNLHAVNTIIYVIHVKLCCPSTCIKQWGWDALYENHNVEFSHHQLLVSLKPTTSEPRIAAFIFSQINISRAITKLCTEFVPACD